MFESLSDRFEGIFKGLRGKGKLRESDVDEALREIRLALLEADVHFQVVKNFRDRVKERAIGSKVHEALNPAQQIVKIVHEELIATLGGLDANVSCIVSPPRVAMSSSWTILTIC